jgi:hypothetical protein
MPGKPFDGVNCSGSLFMAQPASIAIILASAGIKPKRKQESRNVKQREEKLNF